MTEAQTDITRTTESPKDSIDDTAHNQQTYSVYAVQNAVTNRVYVGCSNNPDGRIRTHLRQLSLGIKTSYDSMTRTRDDSLWQRDYDEYGKDSFKYYILETNLTEENKYERELYWIVKYKATNPTYGYNTRGPKKDKAKVTFEDGFPPLPEDSTERDP